MSLQERDDSENARQMLSPVKVLAISARSLWLPSLRQYLFISKRAGKYNPDYSLRGSGFRSYLLAARGHQFTMESLPGAGSRAKIKGYPAFPTQAVTHTVF